MQRGQRTYGPRPVLVSLLAATWALLLVAALATQPAQSSTDSAAWEGSRARCAVCHSYSQHAVVMPHPPGAACNTCHNGAPRRVGCPTCHSIHDVSAGHDTYPTCAMCHVVEDIAPPRLAATATGYVAYLFGKRAGLLIE